MVLFGKYRIMGIFHRVLNTPPSSSSLTLLSVTFFVIFIFFSREICLPPISRFWYRSWSWSYWLDFGLVLLDPVFGVFSAYVFCFLSFFTLCWSSPFSFEDCGGCSLFFLGRTFSSPFLPSYSCIAFWLMFRRLLACLLACCSSLSAPPCWNQANRTQSRYETSRASSTTQHQHSRFRKHRDTKDSISLMNQYPSSPSSPPPPSS